MVIILSGCLLKTYQPELGADRTYQKTLQRKDVGAIKKRRYQQLEDSAPKDSSPKIAKVVTPKIENYSRYGNRAEYTVMGRHYEVLQTAHGYQEKGIASWYGTKFHAHATSSGEEYDVYEMTAAHKTLPLPTYARVTNLENGRQVLVRINDRGPFHDNRIIDLSYAAAKKLGMLAKGTARVEVEAIAPSGESFKKAKYYLQAGAFSSSDVALQIQNKLSHLTQEPVLVEQKDKFFIVKAGPFTEKSSLDELKKQLKRHGIHGAFSLLQ